MKKITILVLLLLFNLTKAQETVGLVFDDVNASKSEGYTLFTSLNDDRVFLMNNCGEVINQWDFSGLIGRQVYILENGNLLQSSGLNVDIRDWDNNVLWSLDYMAFFGFRIHHDIEPLPNGNFLVLVRDPYTDVEMFAEGMDTSYPEDNLVLERLVEIEPVGTNSANIVWEWKLFDHLVQDFDSSKPNFGTVADNPQLLNMNYEDGHGTNPIHANAIDYNEDLDQIAISARHLKEVFVLDHSTTTAQAASHSGGIYGKGGDFLWRWGNPEVYDQGTIADRKLGRQHDIKWITDGPNQGKMSVFNNDGYGTDLTASSIHIIDQNDTNGVYSLSSGKFLPENYFWSYDGTILGEVMEGSSRCGLQIMANGNALINETGRGRYTEVDESGNVVWVYIAPTAANSTFNQFETPTGTGSFRAHRYPEDYVGFNGVTFNNTGIIENVNSISQNCANLLSVDDAFFNDLKVYPNPTDGIVNFNFNNQIDHIQVYDLAGKIVLSKIDAQSINLENLENGLYLIRISTEGNSEMIKIVKN
ncbi:aryl-sulfate sulfotransferase [Winogradskyella sp. PG-2]|uniref:aryl-sulfate sulfotransferase n=1 Tax=Winogradskyella sp. PG-2 TaxID=754409 RepID=UPI0005EE8A9E|nr:aryl-sulfate sulfotransferase [Winogradskyella sp. PG-2]